MASPIEIMALGYIGIVSRTASAWPDFACGVLGMAAAAPPPDGSLRFKLDQREWRLSVSAGDHDGLAFLGLELAGPGKFQAAVDHLRAAGVAVAIAGPELTQQRGVAGVAQFQDPDGNALELFWGAREDSAPFRSDVGTEFVTGALGMGHVLLRVTDAAAMAQFYAEMLGFDLTDFITMGAGKSARFTRCNARHHSIAFVDVLPGCGLEHMMVEVRTLDDLGLAFDRARASGTEITNSIGRHANDRMVSFYVRGPGGIQVEYGWGGRLIEPGWSAHEFQGSGDVWGHHGTMMEQIADARASAG